MHSNRLLIAAATLATAVAALASAGPLQARPIPTARNDWRLQCSNGVVIPHFYGTYGQAANAPDCAPGHVVGIFDNGLVAFGYTPVFRANQGLAAVPSPAKSEPAAQPEAAPRR
jgi:hypothetical protein